MFMSKKTLASAIVYLAFFGTALAQNSDALSDLPECAKQCFNDGLSSAGCAANDVSCFCAHPDLRQSIIDCARPKCAIEDRSSTSGVLSEMCEGAPPPPPSGGSSSSTVASSSSTSPSSTASSTASSSATQSSSTESTRPTTSTTAGSSPTRDPTAPAPTAIRNPPTSLDLTPTTSASGTVVVVQTVNLPDPSNLIGAASSLVAGTAGPIGTVVSVGLCMFAGAALLVL